MTQTALTEEWVLGPEGTPFYTKRWSPSTGEIKAYILFVHGFSEHIARYDVFFNYLASFANLHITAYDQRGHGRTSQAPLTSSSAEVKKWKAEGKTVRVEKNGKRRTGGWGKVFGDMEWFLKGENVRAGGKPLFLWGFSMGGGQALAFPIRLTPPPSKETIHMLSGVIAGGPLIRLSNPAPGYQVKAGSFAANIGLGSFLIPTPMDYNHLSHDAGPNESAKSDPFCEQVGSLRGVADMLNGGEWLDSPDAWDRWPAALPLLCYHGGDDNICDVRATRRFMQGVKAEDKTIKVFNGMYHEVHNETEPTPKELAKIVSEWIDTRIIQPTKTQAAAPVAGQSKL
ncbi:uncharacterized protein IAS62_001788 [Cryptococcus decagattii]|uniref:Serine aminopeptidase S33 domain-containing protein n=1 Tax=Cryptococcus decagattii TaxID=1859122 RepID=A0ABZ2ATG2_9TREE